MKKLLLIAILNFTILNFAFGQTLQAVDTIYLFFLGGQSNMNGFGNVSELPGYLNKKFENTWIFQGNPVGDNEKNGGIGIWEKLQAGHGKGFSSDGQKNFYSKRFGVEISFAYELNLLYPARKIAIIKYAKGGSAIDSLAGAKLGCWEPDYNGKSGINQYDNFLSCIRNANKNHDIDGNGVSDVLIPKGIIWMQGESDAGYNEEVALKYYYNLKRLMELLKAALNYDDLPVIIGKISDSGNDLDGKVWNFCELVQYAQEKYVATHKNTAIIRKTAQYNYSDKWHYDSKGYIDLGKEFALKVSKFIFR